MAPDDQAMRGTPGPLRLKGAKVTKKKKKKKDKASDAETSLTKRDTSAADDDGRAASNEAGEGDQEDTRGPVQKTEAEKRHEEIRRKRVRSTLAFLYPLRREIARFSETFTIFPKPILI